MKHLLIAIPVLLLATAFYIVGFGSGAMVIVALGVILEAAVWLGLFQAKRNRAGAV